MAKPRSSKSPNYEAFRFGNIKERDKGSDADTPTKPKTKTNTEKTPAPTFTFTHVDEDPREWAGKESFVESSFDSSSDDSEENDDFLFSAENRKNKESGKTSKTGKMAKVNKQKDNQRKEEGVAYLNFLMSAGLNLRRKSIKSRRESFSRHTVFTDSNKVSLRSFRTFNEADKRFSEQVCITEEQRKLFESTQKRMSLVEKGCKCFLHQKCSCFKK